MDKDAINFLVRMGRCVEASKELSNAAQHVIDVSRDEVLKAGDGVEFRVMHELQKRVTALKEYID